jgi:V/A-type H+-transporting ATPase subunit D
MPKIKLTKGELKKQRDALDQFQRYLPTLQLKKQQLQMKIFEARGVLDELHKKLTDCEHGILRWVALLADPLIQKKRPR